MSSNAFSNFFNELLTAWKAFTRFQQITIVAAVAVATILLGSLAFAYTTKEYVPLFPVDRAKTMDVSEVENYLDNNQIPHRVGNDKVIYVPKDRANRIRLLLSAYGLPKDEPSKGYELFDSNTWIKGEKELQVLELRAIKGQLESDLRHFSNVRSANVSLDIPPARPFGGTAYKPKASVILELVPGTKLDSQTVRAMTNHVASAVRGLNQNMIAISDTTGRLYQTLDPEGYADTMRYAEVAAEDQLKAKIDGMLSTVVGYNNYYSMVQVTMNRQKVSEERKIYSSSVEGAPVPVSIAESADALQKGLGLKKTPAEAVQTNQVKPQLPVPVDYRQTTSSPGKIERISIAVLIDEKVIGQDSQKGAELKEDLETQLKTILKGYNVPLDETVNFVKFDRVETPFVAVTTPLTPVEIIPDNTPTTILIAIIAGAVIGIAFFLIRLIQLSMRSTAFREQERSNRQADRKTLYEIEDALNKIKQRLQEPAASVPSRSNGEESKVRKILLEADPVQLASFLRNESPETISLILFYLDPARAASILKEFDFDKEYDIFVSLAKMNSRDRDELNQLFQAASRLLGSTPNDLLSKTGSSLKISAKILSQLPQDQKTEIISRLEHRDDLLASKIKESQ